MSVGRGIRPEPGGVGDGGEYVSSSGIRAALGDYSPPFPSPRRDDFREVPLWVELSNHGRGQLPTDLSLNGVSAHSGAMPQADVFSYDTAQQASRVVRNLFAPVLQPNTARSQYSSPTRQTNAVSSPLTPARQIHGAWSQQHTPMTPVRRPGAIFFDCSQSGETPVKSSARAPPWLSANNASIRGGADHQVASRSSEIRSASVGSLPRLDRNSRHATIVPPQAAGQNDRSGMVIKSLDPMQTQKPDRTSRSNSSVRSTSASDGCNRISCGGSRHSSSSGVSGGARLLGGESLPSRDGSLLTGRSVGSVVAADSAAMAPQRALPTYQLAQSVLRQQGLPLRDQSAPFHRHDLLTWETQTLRKQLRSLPLRQ